MIAPCNPNLNVKYTKEINAVITETLFHNLLLLILLLLSKFHSIIHHQCTDNTPSSYASCSSVPTSSPVIIVPFHENDVKSEITRPNTNWLDAFGVIEEAS